MSEMVTFSKEGNVGIILVNNPPVNALAQAVRAGIKAGVEKGVADPDVKAMIILCEGRTFIAGADIREFGKPPQPPFLPDVVYFMEDSPKPMIAAIHGTALGGGLEIALSCHFRIAASTARVGLPEVKLGLLRVRAERSGCRGWRAFRRLWTSSPRAIPSRFRKQRRWELLTKLQTAISRRQPSTSPSGSSPKRGRFRRSGNAPSRSTIRTCSRNMQRGWPKRKRGFMAPLYCVKAVQAAAELPFDQGMKRERELFVELHDSDQSKAQRHVFFAEREVVRIPGLPENVKPREIKTVGILGAGTMGGGSP